MSCISAVLICVALKLMNCVACICTFYASLSRKLLQVDLPLQLCSQDEVEQFLPTIIAALENNRIVSTPIGQEHKPHSVQTSVSNAVALTSLSQCWGKERVQWPQLLQSFVGLPCVDGAIALAPQENDVEITLLHRVFSGHERKCGPHPPFFPLHFGDDSSGSPL